MFQTSAMASNVAINTRNGRSHAKAPSFANPNDTLYTALFTNSVGGIVDNVLSLKMAQPSIMSF
jgi:hypothetical protein